MSGARERLAEALQGASHLGCDEFDPNDPDSGCPDCGDLLRAVDAILSVVQALITEGAAAELEKAAKAMHWPNSQNCGPDLRTRAAALRSAPPDSHAPIPPVSLTS